MSGEAGPQRWLAELRARAVQPPRVPRQPLWLGDSTIGSVEPVFVRQLGCAVLQAHEREGQAGWQVMGEPQSSLASLAAAMRAAGLAGPWRDELLAVNDEATGRRVAAIERGAVRPLGVATEAVHLLAQSPDGDHWVQQRAWSKANDPGLWDTLMGGMVPAADTLLDALARETWEEAGLRLDQLQDVRPGGRVVTRRPCEDGAGSGYVIEHIDWFTATLPDGVGPVNQDGEVERFELWPLPVLMDALASGRFTTEAALLLAARLGLPRG